MVGVAVLTFSSLVFYAERDTETAWTFLDSFCWGLMTLTTGISLKGLNWKLTVRRFTAKDESLGTILFYEVRLG